MAWPAGGAPAASRLSGLAAGAAPSHKWLCCPRARADPHGQREAPPMIEAWLDFWDAHANGVGTADRVIPEPPPLRGAPYVGPPWRAR